MEIVALLGRNAVATDFSRPRDTRVVEIAFSDERQVTTRLRLELLNFSSEFFEKMHRRGIEDGVHGIDAQSVEVIILEPHQCIVEKKSAHFVATSSVKIHGSTPRGCIALGEIGTKAGEVVSRGAQVVVDNIQNRSQPPSMASVHQTLEMIRFPVSVMRGVKVDAVVAPIAIPGKFSDGHQLDMCDAEVSQVIEPVDRRQKRSLRRKSADMKFVKYRRSERLWLPESVRPWERTVIHSAR